MAGTLTISTLSDGTNSTSSTNSIRGSAKAWINFGSTGSATVNASYNVSSLTYNAYGDVTVNFSSAFQDQYYCAVMGHGRMDRMISGDSSADTTYPSWTTTSCRIVTRTTAGATTGNNSECVAFFR